MRQTLPRLLIILLFATALHAGDPSARDAFVQLATLAGRAIAANLVDDRAAVDDVVTEIGERHPVTADLPGGSGDPI